jgi:hypothetical protein
MTLSERIRLVRISNTSAAEEHRSSGSPDHDQSALVHRCDQWRKAFRDANIAYPATLLTIPHAAKWIRESGCEVAARSPQGLGFALSARIAPARVIFHCGDARGRAIHEALELGVGQFIVDSHTGVAMLAACAERPQSVLVDVSSYAENDVITRVLDEERLTLTGLYAEQDSPQEAVKRLAEQMADIRHRHGVLLCRMAVGVRGARHSLNASAQSVDDTLEAGCARFHLPRPMLTICPDWSALTV